ncbi:MAG: DUF4058 family protein [Gemmataceae bacterium]
MPIHDWTRVDAGIFHSFHLKWIAELDKALNGGILPKGYYSLAEQHAGQSIPDLLTLHASSGRVRRPPRGGATAVLEAPKASRKLTVGQFKKGRRRTLAIRHVSEHRLVAIIEIVSSANKDRWQSVAEFATKIETALQFEVNALVLDLFPPGPHDLCGMHGAIWQRLEQTEATYDLPTDQSLTLASYAVGKAVDIYLEHPAIAESLVDMPLFLRPDFFVNVPLEATYQEAFRTMPEIYREILEAT